MQEKDMEFDLEDILREFGSSSEEPEEPAKDSKPEQIPQELPVKEKKETEEDPQVPAASEEQPESEAPAKAEDPAKPEETVHSDAKEEEEDFTSDFWKDILSSPLLPEDEAERKAAAEKSQPAQEPKPEEAPDEDLDEDLRIFLDSLGTKPLLREDMETTRRFSVSSAEAAQDPMTRKTIRINGEEVAAAAEEKKKIVSGDTMVFAPVEEETETKPAATPETAEPFSENWEPKYEEPIGEYVPPEPIVFRPRSRLGELKKKLVAGPERRYYALAEQGLGKLQISIFLSCLVVILSASAVGLHHMGMVQENRMRLLVFSEVFAMLLAALLGSSRLIEGIASVFKGRFTLESLMTVTFCVCLADCFFCLKEVRVPFCAAFCLEITLSQWAEFERRNTEMGQMDTMRKAVRLNRVAKSPDCYKGRPGFFVEDGEVEDFMDTYNAVSGPEKAMNVYALLAVLISGGIGFAAGWMSNSVSTGLRIWSAAILAAAPATAFLCQTRPMAVLERRMHRLGVVLCGWQGVKTAKGKNVMPLTDNDLLPGGSVKVNGVKFYSRRNPDQTVEYATAVIEASGMGIANLFTQLLDSRYGRHFEVENFRFYENGGIGGDVCGDPVLVGSLSFLQEMGVDLPEGARVSQAVYVAVDGELCGVFAMAFGKLKGVSAALSTLCGSRRLMPLLVTENFLLSESFIRAKYNVNTRRFGFPTLEEREAIRQWQPDSEKKTVCALTTQEGLAGVGFAITGARALGSAMRMGTGMHILGGLIGMGIVLALSIVEGRAALLNPCNLLLLELIWAVPGLMITEWTRNP